MVDEELGVDHYKVKFVYNEGKYKLLSTDLVVPQEGDYQGKQVFLTISLGVEHEGWHYKLIAAVICPGDE